MLSLRDFSNAARPTWRSPQRWLLAATALGSWHAAVAQLPKAAAATPAVPQGPVTIRGTVLDDSLNVPISGLFLYLNDTKYGAITDAQGGFAFSFPAAWKPVRGGMLYIQATPVPFTFKRLRVPLDWRAYDPAHPLVLRMASAPGRGRPNLHGVILKAPPVPPPVYPAGLHTIRP